VKPSANNDGRMATSSHAIRRKTGAPIDELCASLAIERVEPKRNGKAMLRITIVWL